jgi:signal transduction histidine kinase
MTLRRRLFATVLVATLGFVGVVALVQVGTARVAGLRVLAAAAERILRGFQAVEVDSAAFMREASEVIVFGELSDEESSPATVAEARDVAANALDRLARTIEQDRWAQDAGELARLRGHARALRDGFARLAGQVGVLVDAPPGPGRMLAYHDAIEAFERGFLSTVNEAVAAQQSDVDATSRELARLTGRTRTLIVGLCAGVAAAVIALLLVVARRIVSGVGHLEAATRRIASGDLSAALPASATRDELDQVAASFAEMAHALRRRTAEVDASHADLSTANQQLAASLRVVQETQGQLVQTSKLAAVGQLAGGLAHEINNPLGVILGFAQGIQRRLPAGDRLELPIGSIVREGLRCKSLVQELLTFSRTARKTTEPCDVNQAVASALVLVSTQAKTAGIEVVQELADDLPAVDGNPTQLQQIIVNLGSNAVDAMEKGGVLTVRTARAPDGVVVTVSDTGSGIPQDVLARMFEPFFTTKEVGRGTGLGLSLVHEMVGQHGGSIAVDTEVGRGTTMRVELPAAVARTEAPRAVA